MTLNPLRLLDAAVMRSVEQGHLNERVYVSGDARRMKRILAWTMMMFIISMACVVAVVALDDGFWRSVAITLLGASLGSSLMLRLQRAKAYRNGWLDGRQALLASARESELRGLSTREWVEAEFERDINTAMRWF